jgi:hypothetical protein
MAAPSTDPAAPPPPVPSPAARAATRGDLLRLPLWPRLLAFGVVLATLPFHWIVLPVDYSGAPISHVRYSTGWELMSPFLTFFVGLHLLICVLGSFPRKGERVLRVHGHSAAIFLCLFASLFVFLSGPMEQENHLTTGAHVALGAIGLTALHAFLCTMGLSEPRP